MSTEPAPPPTDVLVSAPPAAISTDPTSTNTAAKPQDSTEKAAEANLATISDNLLRLNPEYPPAHLPPHSALASIQTSPSSCPSVQSFATALLTQGYAFATKKYHTDLAASKSPKSSEGSTALVTVSKGTIVGEFWAGRRSEHDGKPETGDATWQEFDNGLRVNHSENEKAYTPSVTDAVEVCRWEEHIEISGWKEVTLAVFEMVHKLPAPLKPRVFTIALLTATSTSETSPSSIIVTIPLQPLRNVKASKYTNGSAANTVVEAAYVAVEYISIQQEGGPDGKQKIVWEMATSSDAKGALPMGVQKLGIAGAVVKDVGLFLKWAAEKRQQKTSG